MSPVFSVLIPARLLSSRLPKKLLQPIKGKPVIHHTIDRALESMAEFVWVVADDVAIEQSVLSYRSQLSEQNQKRLNIYMSQQSHDSGTDRIVEAVDSGIVDTDIIVNLQGDEPLLPGDLLDRVAKRLEESRNMPMATLVEIIKEAEQIDNPNIVKVIFNQKNEAIYFSRSVIPHQRETESESPFEYYRHIGVYAYKREWLREWATLPNSYLESVEKLEQLRVLEAGYKIAIEVVEAPEMTGIDSAEQLTLAEKILEAKCSD